MIVTLLSAFERPIFVSLSFAVVLICGKCTDWFSSLISACVATEILFTFKSSNATTVFPASALPSNVNTISTDPSALSGVNAFDAVTVLPFTSNALPVSLFIKVPSIT